MQCLQYGVDIIYHGCKHQVIRCGQPVDRHLFFLAFISEATMTALEAQKDRVFVAPALNWLYSTLNDAGSFGCELVFYLDVLYTLFSSGTQIPCKRQNLSDTPESSKLLSQV